MAVNCIIPIILMFIRPFWIDGATGFFFIAFAVMSGAYLMSLSILTDKTDGAIVRILAAPITMRRYLTENLLACMVPLLVQVLLVSLLGVALYDWGLTLSIVVFLCYTVLTLASVAMAFAWHCLFKSKDASNAGFGFIVTLMAFLSGFIFPLEVFPGIIQYIGAIFPAYWTARALHYVLETGVINGVFWTSIAAMLVFAAAFLLYGSKRRIV